MTGSRTVVALILLVTCSRAFGQWQPADPEELTKAMAANQEHYRALGDFSLRYELIHYQDQGSPQPFERHAMRIDRKGSRYRAEQLGILTLQDENMRVSVDSAGAIVMIAAPAKLEAEQTDHWRKNILPLARSIGKRTTGTGMRYRVMLPISTGFEAVEIQFDRDNWIQELVVLYDRSPQHDHLFTPELLRPKVITRFNKPEAISGRDVIVMDPGTIVDVTTLQPVLRPKWRSYQLIDTRYR